MTMPSVSVVVPTYNEAGNIAMIYDGLAQALAGRAWELVVVDDDLPDGTADAVRALGQRHDNVRCIQRVQERGLCSAVHWGVQAAHGEVIVVMDGDLQHEPELIPKMLEALQAGHDIVSGSRFMAGAAEKGLSDRRRRLSDWGNRLTNRFLGTALSDPLTGFFATSRRLFLDSIPLMQADGFKVFFDLIYHNRKVTVRELPFDFQRRRHGQSKLRALRAVVAGLRHRLEAFPRHAAAAPDQLRRCRADRLDLPFRHPLRQHGSWRRVLGGPDHRHGGGDGLQLHDQQRAHLLG